MTEKTESQSGTKQKVNEVTAKLYMALDDLAFALALEEDEKIRKSDVFKKAQEVIKILTEMRKTK
ncbi:hypothetical protein SBRV1_gp35 [Sulfolobales Beppu rod-shaped virus 1]|uniref:Uncharacterized protein n=1 Tax=Sulfolobales Beppu rod-shaped virus 1 TaxID=2493121 RepID=A0A3Q8Q404_9VIRU|nr:hypothetical protein QIT32_gp35 [Sulfolobales Beppu rod-shaped virus 1]AZI75924.1 hypothetical protein SBRV1_gp35 [Sulfolobales Beppu rod-shaped virus 1]